MPSCNSFKLDAVIANIESRIADNATRFGYKVARGAARHPQSQGKVERYNRTEGELLGARFVELGSMLPFDWLPHALKIAHDYNFAKADSGGASPYEVRGFINIRRFFSLIRALVDD